MKLQRYLESEYYQEETGIKWTQKLAFSTFMAVGLIANGVLSKVLIEGAGSTPLFVVGGCFLLASLKFCLQD